MYRVVEKKPNKARMKLERRQAELARLQQEAAEEASTMTNHKDVERRSIDNRITAMGLVVHDIPADGHCLYNAIVDQLKRYDGTTAVNSSQYDCTTLRRLTAEYMLANATDFEPFVSKQDGDSFQEYCRKIADTATWGGEPEISALTKVLQTPIHIVNSTSDLIKHGDEFGGKPLYLSYHRHAYSLGEHYNSLVPTSNIGL